MSAGELCAWRRHRPPPKRPIWCPASPCLSPPSACRRPHPRHPEDAPAIADGCSALVCLPLLDSSAAAGSGDPPPCLGALSVGFPSEAAVSGAALKAALLLARTLVIEQRQALCDMAALVTAMLLPPPPQGGDPAAGDAGEEDEEGSDFGGSDLEGEDCWTSSEGELEEQRQQGGLRQRRHPGGAPPPQPATPAAAAAAAWGQPSQGRLLAYRDAALERRFAEYHAVHMLGVDAGAYAICLLFYL